VGAYHGCYIMIGRISIGKLNGSDAGGPDIDFVAVHAVKHDLRGHVGGGATDCLPPLGLWKDLGGHTKVGQLDFPLRGEEDVCGLDVPVDDPLRVKIAQAGQNALENYLDVPLGKKSRLGLKTNKQTKVMVKNGRRKKEERRKKKKKKKEERRRRRGKEERKKKKEIGG